MSLAFNSLPPIQSVVHAVGNDQFRPISVQTATPARRVAGEQPILPFAWAEATTALAFHLLLPLMAAVARSLQIKVPGIRTFILL